MEAEERASLQWREDEEAHWQLQHSKNGNYDNPKDGCPSCSRHRVMIGDDKKHRCEKCAWCIEDNEYDGDFSDYIR
jgi:hypothetical protein